MCWMRSTDPEYAMPDYQLVCKQSHDACGAVAARGCPPWHHYASAKTRVEPFTEKQIELITTFADQALIAIENVRLFEAGAGTYARAHGGVGAADGDRRRCSRSSAERRSICRRCSKRWLRVQQGYAGPTGLSSFVSTASCCGSWQPLTLIHSSESGLSKTQFAQVATAVLPRAALERRTIYILDVLADPDYSYGAKNVEGIRTILGVPILKGDDLLGVIMIYRLEVKPFTDKQIALVETFADQAVIAIENVRLLDELRQRTDELGRSVGELRALGEVSQAVNSTLDLETVLSTIVAKAVQLSGTEAGAIYVFDESNANFICAPPTAWIRS